MFRVFEKNPLFEFVSSFDDGRTSSFMFQKFVLFVVVAVFPFCLSAVTLCDISEPVLFNCTIEFTFTSSSCSTSNLFLENLILIDVDFGDRTLCDRFDLVNVSFIDVSFFGVSFQAEEIITFVDVTMDNCDGNFSLATTAPPNSFGDVIEAISLDWNVDSSNLTVEVTVSGGGLIWAGPPSLDLTCIHLNSVDFVGSSIDLNMDCSMNISSTRSARGIFWDAPFISNSVLSGTWIVSESLLVEESGYGITIEGGSTPTSTFTNVIMIVSGMITNGQSVYGLYFFIGRLCTSNVD